MTKLFFLYMYRGQLHKQTPLVTHVYIIFFIRDTFLKTPSVNVHFPSLVTNFPKVLSLVYMETFMLITTNIPTNPRPRTPNEWDNMSVWCDLLQWRNEMYNAVIDAFKDHRQIPLDHPRLHYLLYQRHLSPYLKPLQSGPALDDQKLRRFP
jgi:hypothetical protein